MKCISLSKLIVTLSSLAITLLFLSTPSYATKLESCDKSECVNYFKKFKKYARMGHSEAMQTLGDFYNYGYGTEQSSKKALKQ